MSTLLSKIENNSVYIFISVISAGLLTLVYPYLPIVTILMFGALIIYLFRSYLSTAVIIGVYLVFTGETVSAIRDFVVPVITLALFYLFIKKYGLNFSDYVKVPVLITTLILILFSAVTISIIINGFAWVSVFALFRLSIFIFICYMLFSFIDGRNIIYQYFLALIIANIVSAVSIYADIVNAGFTIYLASGELARFAGISGGTTYVGLTLIIFTSINIILFFIDEIKFKGYKTLLTILLINNIFLFIVNNSRASIGGMLLSFAFILIILNRRLFWQIFFPTLLVTIILLLQPFVQDMLDVFLRLDTVGSREWFYDVTMKMIADNPIFGVGPEMFSFNFYSYLPSNAYHIQAVMFTDVKPNPHNFAYLYLTENGIPGLIFVFLLFISVFYVGIKSILLTKNKSREYFIISVGMTGIMIGIFFRSFFEVSGILSYGFISHDLPFWIIFMILIFIYKKFRKNKLPENFKPINK